MATMAFVIEDEGCAFGRLVRDFAAVVGVEYESPAATAAAILAMYRVEFTGGYLDRRGRDVALSQLSQEPPGLPDRGRAYQGRDHGAA